ncbi:hypothetical protein LAZ67_3005455 [Cordylochernes scorpioides]|uniref:Mos1 transposase HTH domain-containing protein n=1 Tax=Cordylochernes scorpioides TaxID=51811 RepID=A0ABY6KAB8_9ARAC|nr:hypothetical protein LAZ67_3005455 [Cordylochernes scorpioides]
METSEALHWTRQQQKIDIDPEQQLYTLKIVDIAVIEMDVQILFIPSESLMFRGHVLAVAIDFKTGFQAVIKHLFFKRGSASQIKAELKKVNGDSAPSFKTIYYWMKEFKRSRKSTQDEPRPGHLWI